MPVIVPVFPGQALYEERVRLEGRDFLFRFDWVGREGRFYMGIYDAEESPLLTGIKMIANWGFLTRSKWDDRLPPGELIAIDLEEGGEPPGYTDFGTRVRLFYYASDEDVEALAGIG